MATTNLHRNLKIRVSPHLEYGVAISKKAHSIFLHFCLEKKGWLAVKVNHTFKVFMQFYLSGHCIALRVSPFLLGTIYIVGRLQLLKL